MIVVTEDIIMDMVMEMVIIGKVSGEEATRSKRDFGSSVKSSEDNQTNTKSSSPRL